MSDLPAPGWYDDPEVPGGLRWWDGSRWTEDRHLEQPVDTVDAESVDTGSDDDATDDASATATTPSHGDVADASSPFAPTDGDDGAGDDTDAGTPVTAATASSDEPEPWVASATSTASAAAEHDGPSPAAPTTPAPPPPPAWSPPAPSATGAPAWGQPDWGQPAWQPAPRPDRVSGKAAASLILSLLWLFGLASLVAVPLGVMGRREVADSGGELDGTGMATAGIVVGAVGVLFGVLVLVALV